MVADVGCSNRFELASHTFDYGPNSCYTADIVVDSVSLSSKVGNRDELVVDVDDPRRRKVGLLLQSIELNTFS